MLSFKSFDRYDEINNEVKSYIKRNFLSSFVFHVYKTTPFFLTDGFREWAKTFKILDAPTPNLTDLVLHGNIKGVFLAFSSSKLSTFLFMVGFIFWLIINVFILISVLSSLLSGEHKNKRHIIFLFLLLIFYFAILTGPAAQARYRLPVEPLMLILAVFGIESTKQLWLKLKSQ